MIKQIHLISGQWKKKPLEKCKLRFYLKIFRNNSKTRAFVKNSVVIICGLLLIEFEFSWFQLIQLTRISKWWFFEVIFIFYELWFNRMCSVLININAFVHNILCWFLWLSALSRSVTILQHIPFRLHCIELHQTTYDHVFIPGLPASLIVRVWVCLFDGWLSTW